jgi:WD40 repeat protein
LNPGSASEVEFSPDGKYMAIDGNNDIELYDPNNFSVVRTIDYPNVTGLHFSRERGSIITSSTDPHIREWDVATGTEKQKFKIGSRTVFESALSPDGKTVAYDDDDERIIFLNLQDGKSIRGEAEEDGYLEDMAFSPDGSLLATCATYSLGIKLWDARTGRLVRTLRASGENRAVAFSPDGKILAGCGDKTIFLWDVRTGSVMRTFDNGERVGTLAFHPDGTIIAAGGFDQFKIRIWDVQSGSLRQTLEGLSNLVWGLQFSPNGKMLISVEATAKAGTKVWGPGP